MQTRTKDLDSRSPGKQGWLFCIFDSGLLSLDPLGCWCAKTLRLTLAFQVPFLSQLGVIVAQTELFCKIGHMDTSFNVLWCIDPMCYETRSKYRRVQNDKGINGCLVDFNPDPKHQDTRILKRHQGDNWNLKPPLALLDHQVHCQCKGDYQQNNALDYVSVVDPVEQPLNLFVKILFHQF